MPKALLTCQITTGCVAAATVATYAIHWEIGLLGPILLTLFAVGAILGIGPVLSAGIVKAYIERIVDNRIREEHLKLRESIARLVESVGEDAARAVHLAREEGFRDGLLHDRMARTAYPDRVAGEPPRPRRPHLRPVSGG